jgi:hypothetical protein
MIAIRTATNKGLISGHELFKDAVAELTGRRVRSKNRSPKAGNDVSFCTDPKTSYRYIIGVRPYRYVYIQTNARGF